MDKDALPGRSLLTVKNLWSRSSLFVARNPEVGVETAGPMVISIARSGPRWEIAVLHPHLRISS
jgi:hypothetical protein